MTDTLYQTTVTDPVELEDRKLAKKITDAIQQPKRGSATDDKPGGYLPALSIPGFGDEYDDCGDEIPHFCTDCGHSFTVGRTCKRSECPRCAPAWVVDRATSVVGKVDAAARMMSTDLDTAVFKHHVVFSPPPTWYLQARDPLDRTFNVIKQILEAIGAEGVICYHPWSGSDEHDDDRGKWKQRLFSGRDWDGDVREELKPRGHFHAIVAAPFVPGGDVTKMVHAATDWVIHRVAKRDGSGRSLSDLEDVARATTYSLSHTGIANTETSKNNQAQYRYVGARINRAEVRKQHEQAANRAVREVVPKTLGIPAHSVRCGREVGAAAGAIGTGPGVQSEWDDFDAGAGDGDDCEHSASSTSTDSDGETEEIPTAACAGEIRPVDDAKEYLNDPEWVARAAAADELQSTWEDWIREGGWKT